MAASSPTFVVGATELSDPEPLAAYLQRVAATAAPYGGRVRLTGPVTVLEGEGSPTVVTLLEFPDAVAAASWYDSPEYSAIRPLLRASGTTSVLLIEAAVEDRPDTSRS